LAAGGVLFLAVASFGLRLFSERWLFCAGARHPVRNYYRGQPALPALVEPHPLSWILAYAALHPNVDGPGEPGDTDGAGPQPRRAEVFLDFQSGAATRQPDAARRVEVAIIVPHQLRHERARGAFAAEERCRNAALETLIHERADIAVGVKDACQL